MFSISKHEAAATGDEISGLRSCLFMIQISVVNLFLTNLKQLMLLSNHVAGFLSKKIAGEYMTEHFVWF